MQPVEEVDPPLRRESSLFTYLDLMLGTISVSVYQSHCGIRRQRDHRNRKWENRV